MSDPADDLRDEFVRDIRRRFRRIRGEIREWAGYEYDVFGLTDDGPRLPEDLPDDAPDVYRFTTDRRKTSAFLDWLRRRLDDELLEPLRTNQVENGEHWTAEYIRAAYDRAWRDARSRLRTQGVSVGSLPGDDDTELIDALFDMPAPREGLRTLFTRTYRNLQDIGADTAEPVRETLLTGFEEGWNPRKMATELTKEVRTIQHTQAEVLARTETMNAYTEANLDRYERAGVDAVQHGEWSTALDTRVCPICKQLDGREIPIGEMRTGTFVFEPGPDDPDHLAGEYPLRPPAHPQGRCTVLPVL